MVGYFNVLEDKPFRLICLVESERDIGWSRFFPTGAWPHVSLSEAESLVTRQMSLIEFKYLLNCCIHTLIFNNGTVFILRQLCKIHNHKYSTVKWL